jgi:hypothetical protein
MPKIKQTAVIEITSEPLRLDLAGDFPSVVLPDDAGYEVVAIECLPFDGFNRRACPARARVLILCRRSLQPEPDYQRARRAASTSSR